jgi:hypothetical protein
VIKTHDGDAAGLHALYRAWRAPLAAFYEDVP